MQFDAFVAMDWSGAARRYDGIAVAICPEGRAAPELVACRGRRWTREEVAEWLKNRLADELRLLIGLDFAFGFPYEETGYLGGHAPGITDIFSLWALIEERSAGDTDFGCTRFIEDPDFADLFWKAGQRPDAWIERKRRAEHACAEVTKTRPDTLYKLLHSKQVGKGSITGMRVLHHLRTCMKSRVSIWPFELPQSSAIVEIYPTMFRKLATGSIAKLRSRAGLNRALSALGSLQIVEKRGPEPSDHETDALISAAGIRAISQNPAVWSHPELSSLRVRREGWIFGI